MFFFIFHYFSVLLCYLFFQDLILGTESRREFSSSDGGWLSGARLSLSAAAVAADDVTVECVGENEAAEEALKDAVTFTRQCKSNHEDPIM